MSLLRNVMCASTTMAFLLVNGGNAHAMTIMSDQEADGIQGSCDVGYCEPMPCESPDCGGEPVGGECDPPESEEPQEDSFWSWHAEAEGDEHEVTKKLCGIKYECGVFEGTCDFIWENADFHWEVKCQGDIQWRVEQQMALQNHFLVRDNGAVPPGPYGPVVSGPIGG